jgi:nucleoid DNA-binding protein
VSIAGFGKFAPHEIPARDYTNPQDAKGPRISKPPTTRIKFTPQKHFRDCVAGVAVVEKK